MSKNNRIQPLFQLDGKMALVTGASKGIGEAMALIPRNYSFDTNCRD